MVWSRSSIERLPRCACAGGFPPAVVLKAGQVMEQIEGGDLVVNRGNESKPKGSEEPDPKRDLNVVDNYDTALKLSQVCTTVQSTRDRADSELLAGELGGRRQTEPPASQFRCLDGTKPHHLFLCLPPYPTLLLILYPPSREITPVPPVPSLSF